MSTNSIIQTISEKQMDRKDFLRYCGIALLSLVGLKTFVSIITQSDKKFSNLESEKKATHGFGGGKYGA